MECEETFKYFKIEGVELLETLYSKLLALETGKDTAAAVAELRRAAHSLKGAARLVELFRLGDMAHSLEDELNALEVGCGPIAKDLVTRLIARVDELSAAFESATKGELPNEAPEESPAHVAGRDAPSLAHLSTSYSRVEIATLDELSRTSAEIVQLAGRSKEWPKAVERLLRTIRPLVKELSCDSERQSMSVALRSAFEDLSTLRTTMDRELGAFPAIADNLRSTALAAKLSSVDEIVTRLEKIARDTGTELEREVHFRVEGRHLKVDRVVLQKLFEPLSHLVRNAVFHGIEPATVREQRGKPAAGTVTIRFERSVDKFRVVVEDDGGGLDAERIRTAARSSEHAVSGDAQSLIWEPGVSTAGGLSQLAGRGVGLDVVRRAVEELQGNVTVESVPSEYCRFCLTVPGSLDIVQAFVVRQNGHEYLVPIEQVTKTAVLERSEIMEHLGINVVVDEGVPVPCVFLQSAIRESDALVPQASYTVLFLRSPDRRFAVIIDALVGQQRLVVRPLDPWLETSPILHGAASMGNGKPALLLNATSLAEALLSRRSAPLGQAAADELRKPSVLVVDDSLTTRMLEKALLESAGYEANLASDSYQALEALKRGSYGLIIVDFEMPGMDGMELTRVIRADPQHSKVPIIMLTSRGTDDDRRRGLLAGVQAYLVKGRFDQEEFLTTVRGLLGRTVSK